MLFLTSCFSSLFPLTDLCTLAGKCTALPRYQLSSDGIDRLLDALPAISSGIHDPSHSLPGAPTSCSPWEHTVGLCEIPHTSESKSRD